VAEVVDAAMNEESSLQELTYEECVTRLRAASVGRIAVVVDGSPIVLPVNYRLVETTGVTWVAVRTRPGNVIDQASMNVAFEIDEVDTEHHQGWSVLVRGTLHHVDPDVAEFRERFDPEPWLAERDAWLVVQPFAVTGRSLQSGERAWPFVLRAYL
jgi:nitroimidazol reductase NimA-like FMN-containing flavoprotein (pyridoxamine 5'-phosphate oxidase superfamily)